MSRQKRTLLLLIMALLCSTVVFAARGVKIEEWSIPSTDRFPHDPAVAPDGALWYTGMGSDTLGRFDFKSGKFTSYPLKTPEPGPHGLVADRNGHIWFTANYKGYIGRLDPASGAVTEYPTGRHMVATPQGDIYIACSGVGKVGVCG